MPLCAKEPAVLTLCSDDILFMNQEFEKISQSHTGEEVTVSEK